MQGDQTPLRFLRPRRALPIERHRAGLGTLRNRTLCPHPNPLPFAEEGGYAKGIKSNFAKFTERVVSSVARGLFDPIAGEDTHPRTGQPILFAGELDVSRIHSTTFHCKPGYTCESLMIPAHERNIGAKAE